MNQREVWCPACDIHYYDADFGPICPVCHCDVITVVYSRTTGNIITGTSDNVNYEQFKGEK